MPSSGAVWEAGSSRRRSMPARICIDQGIHALPAPGMAAGSIEPPIQGGLCILTQPACQFQRSPGLAALAEALARNQVKAARGSRAAHTFTGSASDGIPRKGSLRTSAASQAESPSNSAHRPRISEASGEERAGRRRRWRGSGRSARLGIRAPPAWNRQSARSRRRCRWWRSRCAAD